MLTLSAPKESNGGAVRTGAAAQRSLCWISRRAGFLIYSYKQETDVRTYMYVPLCRTFITPAE